MITRPTPPGPREREWEKKGQGHYFADVQRGIRWIMVRKCASSALRRTLKIGNQSYLRDDVLKHDDLFTVAFVRHPWQRLISAVHHPLRKGSNVWDRLDRHVFRVPPPDLDVHVQPISWTTEPFRLDFVGDVGNMAADWNRLASLGFDLPKLLHINKSGRPPTDPNLSDLTGARRYYFDALYRDDMELWERAATEGLHIKELNYG